MSSLWGRVRVETPSAAASASDNVSSAQCYARLVEAIRYRSPVTPKLEDLIM